MLKKVEEYLNDNTPMSYYTDGELIKTVAFAFLSMGYIIAYIVLFVLLFTTAPAWIIPYCIYTGRKERP